MNLREKVISGLCWSAGAKLLGQLISWSITIVVIRLLTPGDYGLMSIASIFVALLAMLGELGLGAALIQRKISDVPTLRKVFGVLILVSASFCVLLFIIAPLIALFFKEPKVTPIVRALSFQFLPMGFAVIPQSLLARELDFKRSSLVEFSAAIAASVVTLILAFSGAGVWSLVWGTLTQQLVKAIGLNIVSPFTHLPTFSFRGIGPIFSFGSFVTIERTIWHFYSQSDSIIIGRLLGKELLGFYSVGLQLASLPKDKIAGIINQVAFPAFSKLQGDRRTAGAHFLKAVRIMSFFAFPVLWGASSIAPEIIELLLGLKWQAAIVPFQLLSLVIPVRMVSNLMSPAVLGMGRPDLSFSNTVAAALTLPAALLVGARWGLAGVSLAWVTVFPLIFLFNLSRVVKTLELTVGEVLAAMLRPVTCAAIMYLAVLATKYALHAGVNVGILITSVVLILCGALTYILMNYIFNPQGYREIYKLLKT